MLFEKPINIQLFAEEEQNANADTAQQGTKNTEEKGAQQQGTATVSKELLDNARSEIAELKRQMKELQKTGKSEAELKDLDLKEKDAELEKRGKELNELYIKLNQANANAKIAEIKAKINLENDTSMEAIVDALVTNNGDETTKRAETLSQLLSAVYEKGRTDAKSKEWSDMSNGITSGSGSKENNEALGFIKNLSKLNATGDTQSIKDKFK